MFDRTDFESWLQRIHLYYLGKDNGVNILKSIDEGPFKMGKFRETLAKGALHLGPELDRVFVDLTPEEKERFKANIHATNILLQGGQANTFDDDVDEAPVQDLALNEDNVFQADQCNAFDSDVDETPSAQTMFMANLSSADPIFDEAVLSYDSDILSEIQDHDNYIDSVDEYHEVHEMQNDVQPNYVVDSNAEYTSDSNIILYEQYVKDNAVEVVQSNVSFVPNDALMMIINYMQEQSTQCVSANEQNKVVNESLVAELGRYKEQVELYEKGKIKTTHAPATVHDSEDTLELAETTRMKILKKSKSTMWVDSKIKIAPPDYSKENYLETFTPQRQLTPEQIFWSEDVHKHLTKVTIFKTLKEHFEGIQTALVKEVKEMKEIFKQMEAGVEQNAVDKQCADIERKNLLIKNENLIADCLSNELLYSVMNDVNTVSRFSKLNDAYTVEQARCLELEAEISKLKHKIQKDDHSEMIKRFSNLEIDHLILQLKYQNLKERFGNNKSQPSQDTLKFDIVFEINKMKASLQGKDNAIRKLKEKISQMNERHSEADHILDFKALDFQNIELTEKVIALQEQNKLFRAKNEKVKQHYKELYDSIKITRVKTIEKTTSLNNRKVHLDYLKHLKESVETFCEIVKEAGIEKPLDNVLGIACFYTKRSQELLEYAIGIFSKEFSKRDRKAATTPLNRKKQKPTGRKFTLGEQCPLTRFTQSKVVPLQQHENTPTEIGDPTFQTLHLRLFSNAGRTDRPLIFRLRLLGTGYSLKDKNKATNDKTEHGMEEREKDKVKSKPKSKKVKVKVGPPSCGKGAYYGYNCPPQVPIISNPEPYNNQTIDELLQTLPSVHPTCNSGDENSFTYDSKPNFVDDSPNVFNPPPQPSTYSYEFCGNDTYYGHDFQPSQSPVIHQPPQETTVEMLQAREDLMESIETFLKKFNRISSRETPKVFMQAWDTFFEIKHACKEKQHQPEVIQELLNKLLNDVKIISEELTEFINSPSWNRPAIYYDDDEDYTIAITPDLATEKPVNSLSMGDGHLDTIPATELDKVIKSSVENLFLIPSESKGIPDKMCHVPFCNNPTTLEASKDHSEIVVDSNDDSTSIDDNSLYGEDIDYVDASPPDSELVSLEVVEIVIPEVGGIDTDILLTIKDDILHEKLLNSSSTSPDFFLEETNTFDNSLTESETFCFDLEENSSGSTTTLSDYSFLDYEAFYLDDDHIEEKSSGCTNTHADFS
ncbi:hypothetical protein Tco_1111060 [Tanacetum coccineum]|uniref:Integrase, catalytic region, zinc finger, CCHC-type, peptidase aspartic, catalytic n=1 Tax=Tanacetum coccineum TaxID=301880 RepID=A0ABQ5IMW6_9ASTR